MAEAARAPRSCGELFRVFTGLALQGFGGVLPVAQHVLVERRRWLTRAEFLELLTVAQVLPGPNIVNLSLMLGDRFFGWRGALAALAGMLLVPMAVVLLMAAAYGRYAAVPQVAAALRGMGAVSAGLIIATALKLMPALRRNPMGRVWSLVYAGLTLLCIGFLRWPLVAVLLSVGPLAVATTWWRIHRAARQR
jgi:chromate transporter